MFFSLTKSSHGILLCPATGSGLVLGPISLVHVSYLWYKWIIGIWVSQQRANREQHLGDGKSGAPLFFEDIKTDASVAVDVRVEDLSLKGNLRGLERIIWREMNSN